VQEAVAVLGTLAEAQTLSTREVVGHANDLGQNVQAIDSAAQALDRQADTLAKAGQDNLDRNQSLQGRLDQLKV